MIGKISIDGEQLILRIPQGIASQLQLQGGDIVHIKDLHTIYRRGIA
jgi:antitoxin component of MazEF toxin-antitoxin module